MVQYRTAFIVALVLIALVGLGLILKGNQQPAGCQSKCKRPKNNRQLQVSKPNPKPEFNQSQQQSPRGSAICDR